MSQPFSHRASVFIGRMQPPHWGHVAMLRKALQAAETGPVLVLLGSAFGAATVKNPFSWQQREHILRACFTHQENARLHFLPIRDYYHMGRWCAAVENSVENALKNLNMPIADTQVQLVGHFKDTSSNYLSNFPKWRLVHVQKIGNFDATPIRQSLFAGNVQTIAELVPAPVFDFLKGWVVSDEYGRLKEEFSALENHRRMWANTPFPPVFVTVDAVVVCQGQVLLIERGRAPGRGLWALPGGFLDIHESIFQSCLRELKEETGLSIENTPENLIQTLGPWVFDHPQRSLRGRTITHVYAFVLAQKKPPAVMASDDAARAMWVDWGEIANRENLFFDDHFQILQHAQRALWA